MELNILLKSKLYCFCLVAGCAKLKKTKTIYSKVSTTIYNNCRLKIGFRICRLICRYLLILKTVKYFANSKTQDNKEDLHVLSYYLVLKT